MASPNQPDMAGFSIRKGSVFASDMAGIPYNQSTTSGVAAPGFHEGGDPYWSNVVMFLRGDSYNDLSSWGHQAVAIDACANPPTAATGVALDSSAANGLLGNVACRAFGTGINTARVRFNSIGPEFRKSSTLPYTLDFQLWVDVAANTIFVGSSDASKFAQITVAPALQFQGWSGTSSVALTLGVWQYWRLVYDGKGAGGRYATFRDGVQQNSNLFAVVSDTVDKDFDLFSCGGTSPSARIQQFRWTQGICRTDPNATTCPLQTAPWPEY